uniref:Uncharacterized protein n=1 Tax=Sphaerodactylus townsendi TaxID=933632 RepID=A0ACB8EBT0_9SAUR
MKGLWVAATALLAAACSVLVDGKGIALLRNEARQKEGSDLAGPPPLPALESLAHGGEREASIRSSQDNFSELPRVAFLSKPQDAVTATKEGKGKKEEGKREEERPLLATVQGLLFPWRMQIHQGTETLLQMPGGSPREPDLTAPQPPRLENHSVATDHTTILAVTAQWSAIDPCALSSLACCWCSGVTRKEFMM